MGVATVTYDAPLKKYLMCVTDGWPTCAKMHTYILEADAITGPWRLVTYMKDFGEQAYFVNFPSKFISADGKTLWLCYSANFASGWNGAAPLKSNPPGSSYGLSLHEVRLLAPGEPAPKNEPNPLLTEKNIARKAKVEVSSCYPDYRGEGAIDGIVGGFPNDISKEWATNGEKAGAWIKLSWDGAAEDRSRLALRPAEHARSNHRRHAGVQRRQHDRARKAAARHRRQRRRNLLPGEDRHLGQIHRHRREGRLAQHRTGGIWRVEK